MSTPLISVKKLHIGFRTAEGMTNPIRDISFDVMPHKTTALVGESGSGKSLCALSILRLLPYPNAFHNSGYISFQGQPILDAFNAQDHNNIADMPFIEDLRRRKISFIFQEPMTALNPLHTVERLIADSILISQPMEPSTLRTYILDLLTQVEFENPEQYLERYPHQLSGGQRQRVMIAMALSCNPELLIADEPTTALDVTTQAEILNLLQKLQETQKLTILFISHDLGIVRHLAHHVYVLHQGTVVESGPADKILSKPKHEYTKALVHSEPTGQPVTLPTKAPVLLELAHVNAFYGTKKLFSSKQPFHALKDVACTLHAGETLGVVGESGSGKSTLGLSIVRLIASFGRIALHTDTGALDLNQCNTKALRPLRKSLQIVFQDPFASLNPRLTLFDIISEGAVAHKLASSERTTLEPLVKKYLQMVELPENFIYRYPHELSGGQRQRVAIARTLILQPQVLVLDEPTSALDRQIQKEVLNLLRTLQEQMGMSYIFISHDLKVIRTLAHRVLVMKDGHICEQGNTEQIFTKPQHPYTKMLITSALAYS